MDAKKTDVDAVNREALSKTRDALLRLHKALVDFERINYEKTIGAIQSPIHFLQLLTNDPWFAWLQPLTQIIALMDEMLEEKEPLTGSAVDSLTNQASHLLVASEIGEGFSRHYFDALQDDPDVVFAHADAAKLMRGRARG